MPSEGVAPERSNELSTAQKALVDSFQAFVREVKGANNGDDPAKKEKEAEELRPRQIIFLVALALDITLLYMVLLEAFPNIPDNQGVVFFLQKVLPALGGTLIVSYFKRLRAWLFEQSRNPRLGIAVVALLVVLLVRWWPIYCLFVQVDHGLTVRLNGEKAHFDDTHTFLRVGRLRSCEVVVQAGSNQGFPYHMSVGSVLEGTLARLPFAARKIPKTRLAGAYIRTIYYAAGGGYLYISTTNPDIILNQSVMLANSELEDLVTPATAPKGAYRTTNPVSFN